jgi:hypothetical protein
MNSEGKGIFIFEVNGTTIKVGVLALKILF